MGSEKPTADPILLPDPYDLKKQIETWRSAGFQTEYGIAWMSGGKLISRRQKVNVAPSGIPSTHYTRCVFLNNAAGWFIAEPKTVKDHILSKSRLDDVTDVPDALDANLEIWLKDRREELESWIKDACIESPAFATVWAAKAEADRTGGKLDFGQIPRPHRYTLGSIFMVTEALAHIDQLSLKFQRKLGKDAKIDVNNPLGALAAFRHVSSAKCTPDFLEGVNAGYNAGLKMLSLRAKLANEKAMKMARQTGSGSKPRLRTLWLKDQMVILQRELGGRKLTTKQILHHINEKTDPISGQSIWVQILPGDDEESIQWSDSDSWTLKRLRDRIRRIRTKWKESFRHLGPMPK